MASDPSFTIPVRPERRFRPHEMVYEGGTRFVLTPGRDLEETELEARVVATLEAGPYRYGDFHDLPMAVWLVRDDETADAFRVAVRDGSVRLHVLPATESTGLRQFYARLTDRADCAWTVECRTERP